MECSGLVTLLSLFSSSDIVFKPGSAMGYTCALRYRPMNPSACVSESDWNSLCVHKSACCIQVHTDDQACVWKCIPSSCSSPVILLRLLPLILFSCFFSRYQGSVRGPDPVQGRSRAAISSFVPVLGVIFACAGFVCCSCALTGVSTAGVWK